jgi:purine-binding chemotaxis protein CheW
MGIQSIAGNRRSSPRGNQIMTNEAMTGEVQERPDDDTVAEDIEQDQFLIFTAMGQEFGIQAMRVKEISAMIAITKVPKAPAYIEGILNLRGRLVSVINFRTKFGFESKKPDEDTRIVIVEHSGFPIGIMVDTVEEVIRIPNENVHRLPDAAVTTASEEYLTGVGILDNRLIVLLDADQLLSKAEVLDADALRRITADAQAQKMPEKRMPIGPGRGSSDDGLREGGTR